MAATAHNTFNMSFEATGDLSARQYCFVKLAAGPAGGPAARISLCGAGEQMFGILQDAPDAAGIAGNVCLSGQSKLVVDGNAGAISVGDKLKSDVAGKGVKASTDKDHVGAIALAASTAAGDIIPVIVRIYDLAV